MNAKQAKEAKRALTMLAFAESRVGDFTHVPLTPADQKHAATIVKCEQGIADLGGKEAIQKANKFGEKTDEQQSDRGDVEGVLRRFNTTVGAIAEETKRPAIMDRFRMPHGHGDAELATKLRGFATAVEELALGPALAEHNLTITPAALRQMAADLTAGAGDQGLARAGQAGATAAIPETLKRLRECKKTFEALYANTYAGNAEMMAAWASASHVERTNPKEPGAGADADAGAGASGGGGGAPTP